MQHDLLKPEHVIFLENLLNQDKNNLDGARSALQLKFKLTREEASNIVIIWLKSIQRFGKFPA